MDLALNNLQRLICHKTQTTNQPTIQVKVNNCLKKKCKTRHDWVVKVIHWKLCKKFKFHHTKKRYMYKPESVLENETHKILWNFEIQTDHLILARKPDLVINLKKRGGICQIVDFVVLADHRLEIKENKRETST